MHCLLFYEFVRYDRCENSFLFAIFYSHQDGNIIFMQVLLTEIGSRFVTLPEERLLAVVNALLHRCYKYPTATTAEVPQSLKKELSGVCRACFSADAVNKHVDFVREYKQDFERDLDPESTNTFPATLSELTERLKHWKNVLQSNVEDRFPAVLKLEEESTVLREFHVVDVEVPGQYFTDQVKLFLLDCVNDSSEKKDSSLEKNIMFELSIIYATRSHPINYINKLPYCLKYAIGWCLLSCYLRCWQITFRKLLQIIQ